jgi:hypothetical protein
MHGQPIGYSHTTSESIREGTAEVVRTDSLAHLAIKRFGDETIQEIRASSWETPGGELLHFTSELPTGSKPLVTSGHVVQGKLLLEQAGQPPRTISWKKEYRGNRGVEQSLLEKPMLPGEERTLKMLVPLLNELGDVHLLAKQIEPTQLLHESRDLLRVEVQVSIPGNVLPTETHWVNPQGEIQKSRVDLMEQETFRASREQALATHGKSNLDMTTEMIIRLDKPIATPRKWTTAKYRVQLKSGDPSKVFPVSVGQTVQRVDDHTAIVQVTRISESFPGPEEKPTAEDLAPNAFVQSDDAEVRKMADESRGDAKDPREIALRLERYTRQAMKTVNFSMGFASAAEVAKSREGDCTEHAVLLTALARACGIPARGAMGLEYVDRYHGFVYHMWTEVNLDQHWVPLDGTLGIGFTDVTHLKLADANLAEVSALTSFLPIAQVMGQLSIEVLSLE